MWDSLVSMPLLDILLLAFFIYVLMKVIRYLQQVTERLWLTRSISWLLPGSLLVLALLMPWRVSLRGWWPFYAAAVITLLAWLGTSWPRRHERQDRHIATEMANIKWGSLYLEQALKVLYGECLFSREELERVARDVYSSTGIGAQKRSG